MNRSVLRTIFLLLTLCVSSAPLHAAFVKIEDFQAHTLGQGPATTHGWVANHTTPQITVVGDPSGGANQVLAISNDTSANVRLNSAANGAVNIPNSTTATLYLRFRFTGPKNYSFGMSDVAAPTAFADFESQFNQNNTANDAHARDGGAFKTMSPASPLQPDRWYSMWMVINNTTDKTTFYIDSSTLPGGTTSAIQNNAGTTAFGFRNGVAANPLSCFLIITGGSNATDEGQTGTLYIDDLYLDAAGQNLTNPVPNSLTVANDTAEVGVGGWVGIDPIANDVTNFGTVDPSTLQIITPPTHGTAAYDPLTKRIVYRHTDGSAGTDVFRYQVSNTGGATGQANVNITISSAMRLANATLTLPAEPPPGGALQLVDAFPGLTIDGMVGLAQVPGADKQLIVATAHGANTGSDSSVWMIPDTTAATAVKKLLFKVDSLCPAPFVRGRGIYSAVCHPSYSIVANDPNSFIYLFLTYQGKPDGFPIPVANIPNLDAETGFPTAITCTLRISRFKITKTQLDILLGNTAGDIAATQTAILATELRYLNLAEQNLYHSINDIHFGPDGYFYVSFGDEGDQGEPYHNAQKIVRDQFSSMLRIDVDRDFVKHPNNLEPNPHYAILINPGTGKANFSIPDDNPFVGNSVTYNGVTYTPAHPDFTKIRTEMWATGLRNPFKFDIDPVTNDVWVGDVGQDAWEEVTVLNKGDDAGWSYWEGSHRSPIDHPAPNTTPTPTVHKLPEYDYAHSTGNTCVIGGVFYRGSNYSTLQNKYIFGDHTSGRLWSLTRGPTPGTAQVADLGVGTISQVVDFYVDPVTNDILIGQYQINKKIYRLKEVAPTLTNFPTLLSQTGAFADMATLTPNPGVVPYTPNLKFWSDGADKSRWFALKNTTDQMTYSRDDLWNFPPGMIFVKHFDMELNRDFPGTARKRIETRFLVRNPSGLYGVSYRWNDQGTDATLADNSGEDFDLAIRTGGTNNGGVVTGGTVTTQPWHIPARGECLSCHNANAGHALSMNMRQLNRPGTLAGASGNFLTLLAQSGYLTGFGDNPATLERFYRSDETTVNLDDRVRSFFGVNCSHCHRPNSGIVETWDARGHLSLEQMRILYVLPVSETYHDQNDRLIIPGDKENSLIYNRLQARNVLGDGTHNGYSQMPPIATNVIDQADIQMLAQWIDNYANVAPAINAGTPTQTNVTENALTGAAVATIAATDPDVRAGASDQSALTYAITGGNSAGLFAIDPLTGQVTVNGVLDYETATQYVLTIAAQDHFGPNPKTTSYTFTVNLQDVPVEDANGNGLPDWWENLYTPAPLTLGGDYDHDGLRDFFAYVMAKDPTHGDGVGALVPTRVTTPTPGFQIQWRCRNGVQLGRDYLAETSTDLGTWSPLLSDQYEVIATVPDGPGASKITIFIPSAATNFFFRLKSP